MYLLHPGLVPKQLSRVNTLSSFVLNAFSLLYPLYMFISTTQLRISGLVLYAFLQVKNADISIAKILRSISVTLFLFFVSVLSRYTNSFTRFSCLPLMTNGLLTPYPSLFGISILVFLTLIAIHRDRKKNGLWYRSGSLDSDRMGPENIGLGTGTRTGNCFFDI